MLASPGVERYVECYVGKGCAEYGTQGCYVEPRGRTLNSLCGRYGISCGRIVWDPLTHNVTCWVTVRNLV